MSDLEQEQTQDTTSDPTLNEPPDEQPTPIEPPDEEEEAHEQEAHDAEQTEDVPPEAQAVSQKDIEQVFKKFEKSSQVWRKRVGEIMGDDAHVLLACPMCDPLIPGYIMPAKDVPERFPSVREFMGDAQPAEYQQDPNTRTCMTCAGEGVVETGSRVDSQRLLTCTDCGGKGWQGQRAPVATTGPMAPSPLPEANGQGEPTPVGPEPPEAAKLREMGYLVAPLNPV